MVDIFTIIFQIFWMVLIFSSFASLFKKFSLHSTRDAIIRQIEQKKKE